MVRSKLVVVCLIIFNFNSTWAQKELKLNNSVPITIGETRELRSDILNETRFLNIYLPASYTNDATTKYPVIYLLDGSIDEDFIHIAGLVQFGSFSWINMIPESIIVGITNIDRKKDFTSPSTVREDKSDFPTAGQ
jgi:predicted alpha/beta superfamily hydrolase